MIEVTDNSVEQINTALLALYDEVESTYDAKADSIKNIQIKESYNDSALSGDIEEIGDQIKKDEEKVQEVTNFTVNLTSDVSDYKDTLASWGWLDSNFYTDSDSITSKIRDYIKEKLVNKMCLRYNDTDPRHYETAHFEPYTSGLSVRTDSDKDLYSTFYNNTGFTRRVVRLGFKDNNPEVQIVTATVQPNSTASIALSGT